MKSLYLSLLVLAYIAVLYLTHISFTGYFTDIVILIVLYVLIWIIFLKSRKQPTKDHVNNKAVLIFLGGFTFILIVLLGHPYSVGKIKTTSFLFQRVNNKLYHAYFIPVGSYSGGEGDLIIASSPHLFPLIEERIHYEHSVLWDYGASIFDGQPVNQESAIRNFILNLEMEGNHMENE